MSTTNTVLGHRNLKAAACLVLVAYLAWAILRPLPNAHVVYTVQAPAAQKPALSWPSTGQASVGAAGYGLLASSGQQKPVPMASTAKLVTALAVLQKYPLAASSPGPTLTFSATDVAIYKKYLSQEGSVVPVKAGEKMSEYQALEAMLLPSANNIAYSLAVWAFGSLDNFLDYANNYLPANGLTSTHLADASGFSPKSVSTSNDLTNLALKVAADPILSQVVALKSVQLPIAGNVHNVNWLLGVDGIDGIKTGNTDQAGGCFVFSAQKMVSGQKITVVGAVLEAPNLAAALREGLPLSNSAGAAFRPVSAVKAAQTVGTATTAWGQSAPLLARNSLTAVIWPDKPGKLITSLYSTKPGSQKGTPVGALGWSSSPGKSSPVVLAASLKPPSMGWRLLHPW